MRRSSAALFLLAATTLIVEVLLTRIFDVLLWPNLSFMVISCAMFGLSLGGLFEMVAPDTLRQRFATGRSALVFGLSVWALPLLLNAIPFALQEFGVHPLAQLGWFLLLYLVLLVPFFFAGLCICRIFAAAARDIQRLYFWDLTGAAVGTAILLPLLPRLGPSRLLLIGALASLAASAVLAATRRSFVRVGAIAAALVVATALLGWRYDTLAAHDDKRGVGQAISHGRLEFSQWDPVSQISVLDQPAGTPGVGPLGRKYIAYDGGSLSSHFYPFDGDYAALRRDLPQRLMQQFWQRGVLASHYLRRDTGTRVLVVGSAGGQEVKAARLYGASHVDAVELVGTVVSLATGRYADYIGRIYNDPRVHLRVGEGRSFLRASRDTYDVIQIFSNYTSSSLASGSGALTPAYLLTREALLEYFDHLSPDGILHVNHHTYPRIVTTAAQAWREAGRTDFRGHVLVFEREDTADRLPTILIKMQPWTADEVAQMTAFFSLPVADEGGYRLVENPLAPADSFLPQAFYAGVPNAALDDAPYNVGPISDDKPAFNFLRRSTGMLAADRRAGVNASTAAHLNSQLRRGWLPMDWLHLIVAGIAGVFYAALFLLVPLLSSRLGRERWSGKAPALTYFAMLGFGFIAIELLFIQVFMKLIGYPVYTVATVIAVMLVGAALGSLASRAVAGEGSQRWWLAFAGILGSGLLVWTMYPNVSEHFLAAPQPVRIAVAAALIFPIAFFMGMPFPLGILELRSKPAGAIAWAWCMNGVFTTIGSVASVVLALWLGFRVTVLVALAVYGAAGVCYAAIRRGNPATEAAAERHAVSTRPKRYRPKLIST